MPYISGDLVAMIATKQNISNEKAITKLYASNLYETLESEETTVCQFIIPMLYFLFDQEEKKGAVRFPDI